MNFAPGQCDRVVIRRTPPLFMCMIGHKIRQTDLPGCICSLTHDALHTMTAGLPHAAATAAEAASEHETSSTDMTSSGDVCTRGRGTRSVVVRRRAEHAPASCFGLLSSLHLQNGSMCTRTTKD